MAEMNNLLLSEVNGVNSKIAWLEQDVADINNMMKLLIASQDGEEDQSIKTVMSIVKEKIDKSLMSNIHDLSKAAGKMEKLALTIEETKPKQKRTSRNKKVEPKTIDMVDKIVEKEKEVVNS